MFPSWSWLMALMIGAAVGSFFNMVIYRLPRRLSFSNPPKSFCPKCKHSLSWIDLFPLFSWLSTGGKCRYCKAPIAVRYFLVEVLMGSLFAGLWWQYLIAAYDPVRMGFYMAATACLVAIIFIDWELYIIPDEINVALLVFGVALQIMAGTPMVALTGALAGWGILWGIAFLGRIAFRKDAMGHGDIKMMRGVGALIGPVLMLANMALAVVAGLVIGLALIAYEKSRKQTEETISPEEVAKADEFLVSLRLSPSEITNFKEACEHTGQPWSGVAIAAKSGGAKDYQDLYRFTQPESIGSLLKFGVFYLLCLDVIGVFWHGIYKAIGEEWVDENVEDDTWTPSLTTIPFGPYLAVGAIACLLFGADIEKGIKTYWDEATGAGTQTPAALETVHPQKLVLFQQGKQDFLGPKGPDLSQYLVVLEWDRRLTNMKAGISSPTLTVAPRGDTRLAGSLNLTEPSRHAPGNCLMNWNKNEKNLVTHDGETGAYCA